MPLLSSGGLGGLFSPTPSGPQPFAYYRLDNNGDDSSANGYNSTGSIGTVTYSTTAISGTHSHDNGVLLYNQAAFDIGSSPLTIDCYIRMTATPATITGVLGKYITSGGDRSYMISVADNGELRFYVSSSGADFILLSSAVLSLNTWYRVTAVYLPSTYMRVYIDGILNGVVTAGVPASLNTTNVDFAIGTGIDFTDASRQFNGLIDDVKIYKSIVLP